MASATTPKPGRSRYGPLWPYPETRNTTSRGHTVANRYRVGAHLIRSDGRWLVTALEPIVGGSYGFGCTDVTATPARQDLLAQTCANVARLFSLGYRTLDADLAAQRAAAVEPFRSEIGSVTNPSIRPLAAKEHIVVRATASTAAVEQQDTDTATVLVFLDQNTTVATLKEPRVDRNRLQVTMTRVDGRWLVSGLRAL